MMLLVCGARSLSTGSDPVDLVGRAIASSPWGSTDIQFVVSGGALGVDEAAVMWARTNNIQDIIMSANWASYGKGAGPIRNKHMADLLETWYRRRGVHGGLHTLGKA